MKNVYHDFRDWLAYQKAFAQAMTIFEISKTFPVDERYSLTDQIRRSSRSVCANLSESFRKRIYINHFLSKITDCLAENSETLVWIDFAYHCKYIDQKQKEEMVDANIEIGKLLSFMYKNPDKFGG